MLLGARIRHIRELQNLSQGDLEARCGLRPCYISRVENGHTVPSVETLEKIAGALHLPLYRLFWDKTDPPPKATNNLNHNEPKDWASNGEGAAQLTKLRACLSRTDERQRALLLRVARKMAKTKKNHRTEVRGTQ